MNHIYNNIFGYFDFEEIYRTAVLLAPVNAHFVEVGSFWGKSTAFLAVEAINSGKNIKIDAVDKWSKIQECNYDNISYDKSEKQRKEASKIIRQFNGEMRFIFDNNMRTYGLTKYINPVQGESIDVAKNYGNGSLDFVFIDASHDFDNVKKDIEAWFPKINKNGIIGGHDFDVDTPGVGNAIASTLGGFNRTCAENGMVLIYKGSWIACPSGTPRLIEFLINKK